MHGKFRFLFPVKVYKNNTNKAQFSIRLYKLATECVTYPINQKIFSSRCTCHFAPWTRRCLGSYPLQYNKFASSSSLCTHPLVPWTGGVCDRSHCNESSRPNSAATAHGQGFVIAATAIPQAGHLQQPLHMHFCLRPMNKAVFVTEPTARSVNRHQWQPEHKHDNPNRSRESETTGGLRCSQTSLRHNIRFP